MAQARHTLGRVLDRPGLIVLAVICVLFTIWAVGTRTQPHHVKASFGPAFNLVPGLAVSVDGLEVGKVGKVRYDNGKAQVEIGIDDDHFWPLHQGTKVVSRWGTTIGSGTRRLDLIPGPASAPKLPEDGIIPTADTQAAVDVDQVLDAFTKPVRNHLRNLVDVTDKGLTGHARQLNQGLHAGSAGGEAGGGGGGGAR